VTRTPVGKLASNSRGSAARVASPDPDREAPAPAHEERARAILASATAWWIVGSDEAAYGTLAGALIVGGVAVPRTWSDADARDSKELTEATRRSLVRRYRDHPNVLWAIHRTSPQKLDSEGVWLSLINSHNHVHEALAARLEAVDQRGSTLHIADGLENARARLSGRIVPLSKADQIVPAVSLASCFAKVLQCELMNLAAQRFPDHGFEKHHGYDTRKHREALARFGVTPIHRRSYSTIRKLIESDGASSHRRG